jgi:uncharacterized membrane protein YqiK
MNNLKSWHGSCFQQFRFRTLAIRERGMAEGNRTDWRQLCAAAAKETDSEKLAELVNQLIKALDERGDGFASPTQFDQSF